MKCSFGFALAVADQSSRRFSLQERTLVSLVRFTFNTAA
jgi:hypothetical protein